ncbi:MAG TPA: Rieske 2Fe-2S domain-containing protein [Acidimicrobiales bacterium]|nr:Rieske 2Fe-2S domain-containing protein [Acidimicrobiales bacterium]
MALESPPRPELVGVTRRQFFNRSLVGLTALGLSGFGSAVLAFLWPRIGGAFGSTIDAGSLDRLVEVARDTRMPVYVPAGRFYAVPHGDGVVALFQRCTHLGCRVPFCSTSQWFECGCHQSKYNRVGEWKAGPAPRGLDRFAVRIEDGHVLVDTGGLQTGPPRGTDTIGQEPEGPHCVTDGHAT